MPAPQPSTSDNSAKISDRSLLRSNQVALPENSFILPSALFDPSLPSPPIIQRTNDKVFLILRFNAPQLPQINSHLQSLQAISQVPGNIVVQNLPAIAPAPTASPSNASSRAQTAPPVSRDPTTGPSAIAATLTMAGTSGAKPSDSTKTPEVGKEAGGTKKSLLCLTRQINSYERERLFDKLTQYDNLERARKRVSYQSSKDPLDFDQLFRDDCGDDIDNLFIPSPPMQSQYVIVPPQTSVGQLFKPKLKTIRCPHCPFSTTGYPYLVNHMRTHKSDPLILKNKASKKTPVRAPRKIGLTMQKH